MSCPHSWAGYDIGVPWRVLGCLGYVMVLLVYWMSNRGVVYRCRSFLLLVSMTWIVAFIHVYCFIFQTLLPTPVIVFIALVFFQTRVQHGRGHAA